VFYSSELRSVTCHMGSHSVTCQPTLALRLTLQSDRLVLDLPTPEGWKAELTLVIFLYTEMVYLSRPSGNHLIVTWPGIETTTFWCQFSVLTVTPPSHLCRVR